MTPEIIEQIIQNKEILAAYMAKTGINAGLQEVKMLM
jgi:hypothetical protein